VLRREGFFFGWFFADWEGRVGMEKKKKKKREGDNRQSCDILTFANKMTNGLMLLLVPSAILIVN
jgi:hypothetical protein